MTRDYRVHMPFDVRDVEVDCEVFDCEQWRKGWQTVCDERVPDPDAKVAMLIRSGQTQRDYLETQEVRNGITVAVFHFGPGQDCFASPHRIRARPARLLVLRDGNPRRIIREHTNLRFLAEDYSEHMGLINQQLERG